MLAEVLIFLPSVASFRMQWLEERLRTAAVAASVLMQGDPESLSRAAQNDVLKALGVKAIAVRDGGVSRMLVVSEMPPQVDDHVAIASTGALRAIRDAMSTMILGGDRLIRAYGPVGESPSEYEIVIPDRMLRSAMLVYARNVAALSLVISLIT